VLQVVKLICDGIQSRKLNIKQLSLSMDINGTGFVSRPEFVSVCQQLSDVATLEQIRALANFLDDKNTGKVSIVEFLRVCTETLNSQIGGGVFSFMQVQPVI
jgi:Ca2+-binding EF-hand superfamily protein